MHFPTTRKHRVALIGLGMAVTPHAKSLVNLTNRAEVAAAYSPSAWRREFFTNDFPFPVSDDLDHIFDAPDIDVVAILTPASTHLSLVRRAAAAGKNVLLEKPLDITTAKAESIVAVGENCGITIGVMLQHRFKPAAERLKAILSENGLGKIIGASARVSLWRPQGYYDVGGRGTFARDGGGVLISQAIHTIDLLVNLAGPITRLSAFARYGCAHSIETEDIASATVRFESGAIGVIEATTASFPGSAERIDLVGTKGTASIVGTELEVRWIDGQYEHLAADDLAGGVGADPMAFSYRYHFAAWSDFFQAIDKGRSPRASAREALRVHYVIDAILESAANDSAPIVVRNKFVAQSAS